jgi:hypothetical protein
MFVANPDASSVEISLAAGAVIEMLSGATPGTYLTVSADQLAALVDGSYSGPPVYGVVAGEPILMTVTVEGGAVAVLEAVYLP